MFIEFLIRNAGNGQWKMANVSCIACACNDYFAHLRGVLNALGLSVGLHGNACSTSAHK